MSSTFIPQDAIGMAQESWAALPRQAPTRDDWERHHPLIKRLYVDENRKLKEVVAIMKQYGHVATPKMYKDRIKKWGLDRNNKERDMVAILRKKTERDAVGKESSFRVRGQPVTIDNVLHYFERKKGTKEMGILAASTPSDVSCRTPSPSQGHTAQPIDNGFPVVHDFSRVYCDTLPLFASTNNNAYTNVSNGGRKLMPPFAVDKNITRIAPSGIRDILSEPSRISHSPSLPPTLLIPELLLVRIKTYFEVSFERETWITDEGGYITNVTSVTTTVLEKPVNFLTYMRRAAHLIQMGSLIEFRRLFSKALNLVQELLLQEHPLTLCCFFEVMVKFVQQGHPEIVSLLCRYITGMATTIIARENTWGDICRLVGMLDRKSFGQAIVQCWKCMYETFKHSLGSFHPTTLNILMLLNEHTLNAIEGEGMLRGLVAQSERTSGVTSSALSLLMIHLVVNLGAQGKYLDAEKLGWQILEQLENFDSRIHNLVHKMEVLGHIAWIQYYQDKTGQAENTMRDVIKMTVDQWGATDTWAISNTVYLERWLRSWGREEDAHKLKADIEELIGKDEIDEQSVGEQSPGVQV